jgi:hypothetical protein
VVPPAAASGARAHNRNAESKEEDGGAGQLGERQGAQQPKQQQTQQPRQANQAQPPRPSKLRSDAFSRQGPRVGSSQLVWVVVLASVAAAGLLWGRCGGAAACWGACGHRSCLWFGKRLVSTSRGSPAALGLRGRGGSAHALIGVPRCPPAPPQEPGARPLAKPGAAPRLRRGTAAPPPGRPARTPAPGAHRRTNLKT